MTDSKLTTLDNGLRVATVNMQDVETVALSIWVDVGSRYEKDEEAGLSHFLEHMAFKGTPKRNAQEIAEALDNVGGYLNAHTSREHTVYTAKVLKNDFDIAIDVLSDILQNSLFDKEELERERGVILQEIAMCHDTPDDIVFDHFQRAAFSDHPIGRPILGDQKTVKSFKPSHFKDYTKRYYKAERMVVSVAGNIDHNTVIDRVKKCFSSLESKGDAHKETASYLGGEYLESRDLEQVHYVMGFQGIPYIDDKIYSVQLLSYLLGGGMSSRLFQEIREKRGLAYAVSSFSSSYLDSGVFVIYAGTGGDKIKELINVTCDELKKVGDNISTEELDRAKAQAKSNLLMSRESSSARADELGRHHSIFKRHIPKEEILEKIDAVNNQDISSMMQYLLSEKLTVAAIGKLNGMPSYEQIEARIAK